ncbi:MAG: hypothetical protein JSW34_05800 [Candidatus Zixiibacteriota bacterium]|nr:MAG: hypothetical protein JSW34_05800 [candidate division Zixibacteria bacterium]
MKHLTLLVSLLLLATVATAAENPVDKGSFILEGSAFFMSQGGDFYENLEGDGQTTIAFMPSLGYFVAPSILIGAEFEFESWKWGDDWKENYFAIGPVVGYYFNMDQARTEARGAVYPFIKGFFMYGSSKIEILSVEETIGIMQFGGQAGVIFMLSNAVGLNFGGMFASTSFSPDEDLYPGAESVSGTTIMIGAGVTAFVY